LGAAGKTVTGPGVEQILFGAEFLPFGGKNAALGNACLFWQAGIRIFTAMEK
jgi:hypothetical protein